MKTIDGRVRRAIAAVAAGRPVVLTDDSAQGNDAHLVFAADAATPELLAFTIRHTSGFIRAALPPAECERLDLPPMLQRAGGRADTAAQRVAVDRSGPGTGISATDRARTIAALASEGSGADDFSRPGHVIPVESHDDGVLGRPGAAEAAVDLSRLGGRRPAGVLCEIVSRDDPTGMATGAESVQFAVEHGLAVVSIGELASYRRRTEPQVVRLAQTTMPAGRGVHRVIGYRDIHDGGEHLVVIVGTAGARGPVPLHVHVECICGDVFGSSACACGGELDRALASMTAGGCGVIVYLRPSGSLRGCGLSGARDAPSPDLASQTVAWILRDLGVYSVRLSDDTPGFGLVMFGAIREHGLQVQEQTSGWRVAG